MASFIYTGKNIVPKKATTIIVSSDVTEIKDEAFRDCTAVTYVLIPSSVKVIGRGAFRDCSSLSSIDGTVNVHTIREFSFCGCTSLTSVDNVLTTSSVTTIERFAFNSCESLTSITVPSCVTSIAEYAFAHCSSLIAVDLPPSVNTIQLGAFMECTSLPSIQIPSSVTTIERSTFHKCHSLTTVLLPSSIKVIEYFAFSHCTSLPSITIPPSCHLVHDHAFSGCTHLDSIVLPKREEFQYLVVAKPSINDCYVNSNLGTLSSVVRRAYLPSSQQNQSLDNTNPLYEYSARAVPQLLQIIGEDTILHNLHSMVVQRKSLITACLETHSTYDYQNCTLCMNWSTYAKIPNPENHNRFPLYTALTRRCLNNKENKTMFHRILKGNGGAVSNPDTITNLEAFMLAAVGPTSCLEIVYTLLEHWPAAVQPYVVVNRCHGSGGGGGMSCRKRKSSVFL